jgi:hypothetical protein
MPSNCKPANELKRKSSPARLGVRALVLPVTGQHLHYRRPNHLSKEAAPCSPQLELMGRLDTADIILYAPAFLCLLCRLPQLPATVSVIGEPNDDNAEVCGALREQVRTGPLLPKLTSRPLPPEPGLYTQPHGDGGFRQVSYLRQLKVDGILTDADLAEGGASVLASCTADGMAAAPAAFLDQWVVYTSNITASEGGLSRPIMPVAATKEMDVLFRPIRASERKSIWGGNVPPVNFYACQQKYEVALGEPSKLLNSLCTWWSQDNTDPRTGKHQHLSGLLPRRYALLVLCQVIAHTLRTSPAPTQGGGCDDQAYRGLISSYLGRAVPCLFVLANLAPYPVCPFPQVRVRQHHRHGPNAQQQPARRLHQRLPVRPPTAALRNNAALCDTATAATAAQATASTGSVGRAGRASDCMGWCSGSCV